MSHKVLIIEDNTDIATLMQLHLRDIHCHATIINDGAKGLAHFAHDHYDLVLLDVMLPSLGGLEVCKRLREQDKRVPIIMLTSKSSELDRVLGLEVGADDYVSKPFSIPELLARIKSQFRRLEFMQAPVEQMPLTRNALTIEPDKHRVTLAGKPLELTAKEFDLLLHFASHPGRVYSRTDLLNQIWGYSYEGYEHTVNSHINRLRAKIEDTPTKPNYILTVWGVGYKFNEAHS